MQLVLEKTIPSSLLCSHSHSWSNALHSHHTMYNFDIDHRQTFTNKAVEHPPGLNTMLHIVQIANYRLDLCPTPCNRGKMEAGNGDPRSGSQADCRKILL